MPGDGVLGDGVGVGLVPTSFGIGTAFLASASRVSVVTGSSQGMDAAVSKNVAAAVGSGLNDRGAATSTDREDVPGRSSSRAAVSAMNRWTPSAALSGVSTWASSALRLSS